MWIIIVSVLAGVILLGLIVILLWKVRICHAWSASHFHCVLTFMCHSGWNGNFTWHYYAWTPLTTCEDQQHILPHILIVTFLCDVYRYRTAGFKSPHWNLEFKILFKLLWWKLFKDTCTHSTLCILCRSLMGYLITFLYRRSGCPCFHRDTQDAFWRVLTSCCDIMDHPVLHKHVVFIPSGMHTVMKQRKHRNCESEILIFLC